VLEKNLKDSFLDSEEKNESKPTTIGSVLLNFFEFIKTVIIIVILAAVIRLFVIQPFIVDGQSMEPNFQNNDYLITEKVSFHFSEPRRGETVILRPPDNPTVNYLKRIIGIPGDTVSIKKGDVYVNAKKIDEPYIDGQKTLTVKNEDLTVTLKQDEYFVMGDNRNHSRDSREIGPVPRHNLVSHVWIRLFPFNKIKLIQD
jgi:signal peptidase I